MDDLTQYILNYYPELMTNLERDAHQNLIWEARAEHCDSLPMQRMLRKKIVQNPEVDALLAGGNEQFYANVRYRILRERSDDLFLNYCPKCHALARTPKAQQCRRCFFSWHADKSDSN